jgi:transcriptional regulator with XRE-family HTH domain
MSKSFGQLKTKWLKQPRVKAAYDALAEEFDLAASLIDARRRAGLSQIEVAKRMGVSQPSIARLEAGHKPSLRTLERYAKATNARLVIRMTSQTKPHKPNRTNQTAQTKIKT